MNIFFDTSVLVAASSRSHPHYVQAFPALLRVASGRDKGFISTHSIAEVYAALTRLPVVPRIHPAEAARIVADNLLSTFEAVPVNKKDYLEALATVKDGGWSGAKIYDALLLCCAASVPSIESIRSTCRFQAAGAGRCEGQDVLPESVAAFRSHPLRNRVQRRMLRMFHRVRMPLQCVHGRQNGFRGVFDARVRVQQHVVQDAGLATPR